MFVVGRVLDPQGKPVPERDDDGLRGAQAAADVPTGLEMMAPSSIGQAPSDESGRFRLDVPRTSSSTHEQAGAIAIAPGYGAGWVDLDLDADQTTADITLRPEQVIQGRLFDLQGRPVQGVTVSVAAMGRVLPNPEGDPEDESLEGPIFCGGNHAKSLPAWPRPAPTDAEGRFTVRGAGQGLRVILVIDDPRFARQLIKVDTDNTPNSKPLIAGRGTGQDHRRARPGSRHRKTDRERPSLPPTVATQSRPTRRPVPRQGRIIRPPDRHGECSPGTTLPERPDERVPVAERGHRASG